MSDTCELTAIDDVSVSVTPAEQNISVVRGTDNTFEAILTDGDGEPVDISLDTIVFTVRDKPGGTVMIQISNAPGTHKDGPSGVTEFAISKADITNVSAIRSTFWVYEIRRIRPGGAEHVHIQGQFIITPSVGGIDGD